MGDEVIHLPEAPVVMGESKVIAPATGYLVDLPHDFIGRSPGGGAPGKFAHTLPQRLLCGRARFGMHIRRSLLGLEALVEALGSRLNIQHFETPTGANA